MRQDVRYILSVILFVAFSTAAVSQSRTSYFVANSPDRHRLNASFAPQQGYVGIPFLSNLNICSNSNVGVGNFMFSSGDGTVLFMNPSVSSEQFLSSLKDRNYLDADVSFDVLDVGWRTGKDFFWTVSVGFRGGVESDIPREFFTFLKNGFSDSDGSRYTITDVSARAGTYLQAVVGFSAPLKCLEGFRMGGKLRLLAQTSSAVAEISDMEVLMNEDIYTVSASGAGYVAGKGILLDVDENGKVTGVKMEPSQVGVTGWGFGCDFGVSYRLSGGTRPDGLLFSASVSDFRVVFTGDRTDLTIRNASFDYSGINMAGLHDSSVDKQFSEIGDRLRKMFSVKVDTSGTCNKESSFLAANVHAGLGYEFMDGRMTVGLLYSHRFGRYRQSDELTLSYNYAPVKCFDAAVSFSFLNNVRSAGLLLTFVPWKGMNVIIGSDYNYLRYSAHGIPIYQATLDLKLGLSVPIQAGQFRH